MRKVGRKKQARSNKQEDKATQHTQGSHFPIVHVCPSPYRETEENFEEVHGRLKRGDIIGVTGSPG